MTERDRYIACMEYESADRRPNHELGVWGQTRARWEKEAPDAVRGFTWDCSRENLPWTWTIASSLT